MPMNKQISVLLPTYNNESTLQCVLESVKWAAEIVVVDSYSTDKTLEIAKRYNAKIIQHEYVNSAKQKNWAIPQCKHSWVFQIDSDEELDDLLIAELRDGGFMDKGIQVYEIARKNYVLGVFMKECGLYPDYQTRLFLKEAVRFNKLEVHARIDTQGKVGRLRGTINHYGMSTLSRPLEYLNRYTRYEANELLKRHVNFKVRDILIRPFWAFFLTYVGRKGWRCGMRGFILSVHAANYVFWKWAKLWEIESMRIDSSPE